MARLSLVPPDQAPLALYPHSATGLLPMGSGRMVYFPNLDFVLFALHIFNLYNCTTLRQVLSYALVND